MKKRYYLYFFILFSLTDIHAENVVINVVVPNPTYECYIAGNFNNFSIVPSIPCTKIDPTHYTVTLNDSLWAAGVTHENLSYKFLNCQCDWACAEKGKAGEEVDLHTHKDGVNDTVLSWSYPYYPELDFIKVLTPPETEECYLMSNLLDWQEPNDLTRMMKYYTDENGNIIFRYQFLYSACSDIKIKYFFSCGPSMEYIQANPVDTFLYSETNFPTIISWKKTFHTNIQSIEERNIRILSNGQKVVIEGLWEIDHIFIYDLVGKLKKNLETKGKSAIETDLPPGYYILKSGNYSGKIVVK